MGLFSTIKRVCTGSSSSSQQADLSKYLEYRVSTPIGGYGDQSFSLGNLLSGINSQANRLPKHLNACVLCSLPKPFLLMAEFKMLRQPLDENSKQSSSISKVEMMFMLDAASKKAVLGLIVVDGESLDKAGYGCSEDATKYFFSLAS